MQQVILVPGLGGSEADHWQSRWARERSDAVMVQQRDWDRPERTEWVARLDATIRQAPGPVILVAHSLGCHTLAHWAAQHTAPVAAALLVAPPDIERSTAQGAPIADFRPPTAPPFRFPAVLAASRTDPWSDLEASRHLAQQWGATWVDVGDVGHVNVASGHGPWPQGEELLHELMQANGTLRPRYPGAWPAGGRSIARP